MRYMLAVAVCAILFTSPVLRADEPDGELKKLQAQLKKLQAEIKQLEARGKAKKPDADKRGPGRGLAERRWSPEQAKAMRERFQKMAEARGFRGGPPWARGKDDDKKRPGARPSFGRRGGFPGWSPEQAKEMRERFQKMAESRGFRGGPPWARGRDDDDKKGPDARRSFGPRGPGRGGPPAWTRGRGRGPGPQGRMEHFKKKEKDADKDRGPGKKHDFRGSRGPGRGGPPAWSHARRGWGPPSGFGGPHHMHKSKAGDKSDKHAHKGPDRKKTGPPHRGPGRGPGFGPRDGRGPQRSASRGRDEKLDKVIDALEKVLRELKDD